MESSRFVWLHQRQTLLMTAPMNIEKADVAYLEIRIIQENNMENVIYRQ